MPISNISDAYKIKLLEEEIYDLKNEIDMVSFVVFTNETQTINEDETNPSFFTDLILGNANKVSLHDPITGAVRNESGKTIPYLEGTLNFQPNKTGGGTSRLHLISERSTDNGLTWFGNYNSLRSIEVSNSGETFKTVISILYDWLPGELCRFRCFNDAGGNMVFEAPSDTILGEIYTGPALLWTLQQRLRIID